MGSSADFVGLIYLFFILVARALWRDLRASVAGAGASLGRLIVTTTTDGGPATGTNYPLDAVNSIGRDVNNSIVIDDTYRLGRPRPADLPRPGLVRRGPRQHKRHVAQRPAREPRYLPLGYGDELQIGAVRIRLERARPT